MSLRKKIVRDIAEALEGTGKQAVRRAGGAQIKRRTLKDVMSELPPEVESFASKRKKRAQTGTVNIGLVPSKKEGGQKISRERALQALRATGRRPLNVKILQSASEPTLIADVKPPLSARETYMLSHALRQDAIAQRTEPLGGMLEGPRAADWGGQFSPAYFFLQEGDTLGSGAMTDLFRSGAPREDLMALADKWGWQPDPVNLDINLRLRDEYAQRGEDLPASLGVFTGRSVERDPAALAQFREAQKRLVEREIAERGRTNFGLRDLPQYLDQLPSEEELARTLRETQLPLIGPAPQLAPTAGRGVHISTKGGLEQLDPSYYGSGHRGEEYPDVIASGRPNRTYFYVGPEGTLAPEASVLGVVGGEMRRGPRYAYEANLSGLYDINDDPERLRQMAQAYNLPFYEPKLPEWAVGNRRIAGSEAVQAGRAIPDMEKWIRERGYRGYLSDFGEDRRRAAAVFEPTNVEPIDTAPIDDWRRKFAVGGRVR